MSEKKAGLRESTFADGAPNEPHTIMAHTDCIEIHTDDAGEDRVVCLRPRHIHAIAWMHEDWWDREWAQIMEEEA